MKETLPFLRGIPNTLVNRVEINASEEKRLDIFAKSYLSVKNWCNGK